MSGDRDRLRGALEDWNALPPIARMVSGQREAVIRALLPVVDRIANERAAAELRAMAQGSRPSKQWLLDRADALDPM